MRRLLVSTFVFFLVVSIEEAAISGFVVHVDPPGLPNEVLTCPVYIRGDSSDGTAFFMFHNDYGYLITARHLLYRFSKRDSTWSFKNKSILIAACPDDPGISAPNQLLLTPSPSDISKYCKCHSTQDIAAIQLGRVDTSFINFYDFIEKSASISSFYAVDSSWVKTYDKVHIGNEAFIFGYPTSIGLYNSPHVDEKKPLLRNGVIAGKNESMRVLILDCPVYPGNSGGPVFEHVSFRPSGVSDKILVIGVVTGFVPFTKRWNSLYGDSMIENFNSGYSVIVPIDDVFDLINKF